MSFNMSVTNFIQDILTTTHTHTKKQIYRNFVTRHFLGVLFRNTCSMFNLFPKCGCRVRLWSYGSSAGSLCSFRCWNAAGAPHWLEGAKASVPTCCHPSENLQGQPKKMTKNLRKQYINGVCIYGIMTSLEKYQFPCLDLIVDKLHDIPKIR